VTDVGFPPQSITQAFDHSNVNTGWVVGSGTEGKLLIPGWTYKIEGLYMDLGHLDARGPGGSLSASTVPGPPPASPRLRPQDQSPRTPISPTPSFASGVNYQFHYGFCKSSGSLAIFAAIRRASSGGYQGHSAGTHRKVAWSKRSLESEPSNASCPCPYCRCWSVRSGNDRPRARRNFRKGARQ